VRGLPTPFGTLDFAVRAVNESTLAVRIGGTLAVPPGGLTVAPPCPPLEAWLP
jgi:hypothetical protein